MMFLYSFNCEDMCKRLFLFIFSKLPMLMAVKHRIYTRILVVIILFDGTGVEFDDSII